MISQKLPFDLLIKTVFILVVSTQIRYHRLLLVCHRRFELHPGMIIFFLPYVNKMSVFEHTLDHPKKCLTFELFITELMNQMQRKFMIGDTVLLNLHYICICVLIDALMTIHTHILGHYLSCWVMTGVVA